jgi:hypothetical protein
MESRKRQRSAAIARAWNPAALLFEGARRRWAEKPFPAEWQADFSLVGLGLPEAGDNANPWNVCYFVDAANHYFTAYFEDGRPSYVTVDG